MLYVSRMVDYDKYGVVDTDDDVETVVTTKELSELVYKYGLDIKGTVKHEKAYLETLRNVIPYQDKRYYSPLQSKTKTLLGVDVRTYKGEIVRIMATGGVTKGDTEIRLSDFGERMSGRAVVQWDYNPANLKLVLVVDDKIQLEQPYPSVTSYGQIWDIREMKRESIAEAMYRELLNSPYIDYTVWGSHIRDSKDRESYWRAVHYLDQNVKDEKAYLLQLSTIKGLSSISEHLGAMYRMEFTTLAHLGVDFIKDATWYKDNIVDFASPYIVSDRFPFRPQRDYEWLRVSFIRVFNLLKVSNEFSYYTVRRFENFIRYYPVPDDIKVLYVALCNTVVEATAKYLHSLGS